MHQARPSSALLLRRHRRKNKVHTLHHQQAATRAVVRHERLWKPSSIQIPTHMVEHHRSKAPRERAGATHSDKKKSTSLHSQGSSCEVNEKVKVSAGHHEELRHLQASQHPGVRRGDESERARCQSARRGCRRAPPQQQPHTQRVRRFKRRKREVGGKRTGGGRGEGEGEEVRTEHNKAKCEWGRRGREPLDTQTHAHNKNNRIKEQRYFAGARVEHRDTYGEGGEEGQSAEVDLGPNSVFLFALLL